MSAERGRWQSGRAFALLAGSMLVGCAAQVGAHHRRHRAELEQEPEAPPPKVEPWKSFGLLAGLETVGEPRISGHRLGDEVGSIRINHEAVPYTRGQPVPEGAMIVESLSPEAGAPPSSHFVMTKRQSGYFPAGGDWEYLVVNPEGGVIAGGQLPRCARCHAEARTDFVFGWTTLPPKPAEKP